MIKECDKKGLSTIVATLIIILLVLVAVGIIWVVIRNVIQQGSEQVSLGKFTLDLQIEQVQTINDSSLNVKVKRNAGPGEFVGLKFIIEDNDEREVITYNGSLSELDERLFLFSLSNVNASNLKKVSIAPIFRLESGKEITGDVKDEFQISSAGICSPICDGRQCGSDGCGGSCGTCASGSSCQTNGTCTAALCTDTCSSLGLTCGNHTICGVSTSCGTCSSGFTCQTNGTCLANPCIDTCVSLGYTCGTRTICGASVNCGTCASGSSCQTNGTCIATCTDTCASLGYQCGARTVCGISTVCGTCSSGFTCQVNGTCLAIPCTDTCSSLEFNCGTRVICGASVNCGTCASGSSCQTNGTCIVNPPTCTDTCSSLGYTCGTRTICGASVNCGTCSSGFTCQVNGTCIASPSQVLFSTDFESGQGSWSATGDWQLGDPSVTGPATAHSENNCWATNIDGDYSADSNSVLTSPQIDLTVANAILTFWTWYNTESGWDGGHIEITTDLGSTWTIIPGSAISPTYDGLIDGAPGFNGDQQSWREITVNLGAYVGNNVQIRFVFNSDYGLQLSGWYIDDLEIIYS